MTILIGHCQANFWNRGEYPMNTELFIKDKCVFRSGAGFRLFGGMSRLVSTEIFGCGDKKEYGKKRIKYPLFGNSGLDDFKF